MDAGTRAAILAAWERRPDTRPEGLRFQFNDWRINYWGKTQLISCTSAEALARDGFALYCQRNGIPIVEYSTIALARAVCAEGD